MTVSVRVSYGSSPWSAVCDYGMSLSYLLSFLDQVLRSGSILFV